MEACGYGTRCDQQAHKTCGLPDHAIPADQLRASITISQEPSEKDEDRAFYRRYPLPGESGFVHLYAVFDGHGGKEVSDELDKEFSNYLMKQLPEYPGNSLTSEEVEQTKEIIHDVFLKLDTDICAQEHIVKSQSGSTATVAFFLKDYLFVANSGDSRTAIYLDSKLDETTDHKPSDDSERARIEKTGGYVEVDDEGTSRLMGVFAVSRSFGDCDFKHRGKEGSPESKPYTADGWMSVVPDVLAFKIGTKENRKKGQIVLASDGVWDALRSEDSVKLQDADEIVNTAFDRGSRDDISAIMIRLH